MTRVYWPLWLWSSVGILGVVNGVVDSRFEISTVVDSVEGVWMVFDGFEEDGIWNLGFGILAGVGIGSELKGCTVVDSVGSKISVIGLVSTILL